MDINVIKNEKELTIGPVGHVDSITSEEFAACVQENFTQDIEKLTLDFSQVDFISSKGLRVIISIYKSLDGRQLELVGTNASVKEVFRVSGLLKVLDVK